MKDVIIVGGGLAGLVNAIIMARAGLDVILIEKKQYPFHRVCGEYVSNEVVPFLKSIDGYPASFDPPQIQRFMLSSVSGKKVEMPLDLGGFGLSRYSLDHHLYELAKKAGSIFRLNTTVDYISYEGDHFQVWLSGGGEILKSRVVVGAYGKRSKLDTALNRSFMKQRSPFLAVKYHINYDIPNDLIALHNFEGGYCGISKVEDEKVNLCYLSHRRQLKKYKSINDLQQNVLCKNPLLATIFNEAEFLFEKPLVINEISFEKKSAVENHVLMSGDSSGLITPLCGNGMAMAIHSAKVLSDLVIRYFKGEISRKNLEQFYQKRWNQLFSARLWVGRRSQSLFGTGLASELAIFTMKNFKPVARTIMKNTHGEVF
ncbi:NAD(P)/FAD-dependent oxidoreductase [Fulvivirgaceae bacterium BMA12]|uniref:NAD(P)/FAD-dependent oxidoreductase n=1 Tax=Agaribacillus aureus TaxID=3051825 RepID=A0ABT8LEJ5_9BACT|nr:NAD(P)/FAD-dependent oxidoreductase [Fulvivirgaceae bacterium BMA12]